MKSPTQKRRNTYTTHLQLSRKDFRVGSPVQRKSLASTKQALPEMAKVAVYLKSSPERSHENLSTTIRRLNNESSLFGCVDPGLMPITQHLKKIQHARRSVALSKQSRNSCYFSTDTTR